MKTYFVRHTEKLDIDEETLNKVLKNGLIAIHYPDPFQKSDNSDNTSLDPNDYKRNDKGAIRTLRKLSKEGGHVCAEYRGKEGALIGMINPETQIEFLDGKWRSKKDRTAKLKTLSLSKPMWIDPVKYLILSAGRPQQGTICQWHKAKDRIKNLVENIPSENKLDNLPTSQQEVLCSEYLRSGIDKEFLPQIQSLLLPVGRTLQDVDIIGIDQDGTINCIQVTYNSFKESQEKLESLKKYKKNNSRLILFCRTCDDTTPRHIDGVLVYPLELAFDNYCKTPIGKKWLESVFD